MANLQSHSNNNIKELTKGLALFSDLCLSSLVSPSGPCRNPLILHTAKDSEFLLGYGLRHFLFSRTVFRVAKYKFLCPLSN
jgi:hypothetical protein